MLGQTLRFHSVVQVLDREELDLARGQALRLPEQVLQGYLTCNRRGGNKGGKLSKLERLLDIQHVTEQLRKGCGAANHTCMLALVGNGHAVLRWRVAFYALGKLTRLRHLCSMYRAGMQGQAALIAEFGIRGAGYNFQYNFLGVKVCRKAFVAAVGLSESVLQRCFWSETRCDSS